MATSKGRPPGNPVVVLLENFRKRGIGPLVWLGVALLVLTVTLMSTFTVIDPGQVAVRVNNLTGARERRLELPVQRHHDHLPGRG